MKVVRKSKGKVAVAKRAGPSSTPSPGSALARTPVLPVFLRMGGKKVVVVGGGEIGTRKARELALLGADVLVVTKRASPELAAPPLGDEVRLELRPFRPGDLDGAWFVVAATSDPAVNLEVARAAAERRIFVCAVDDKAAASAYFGGIVRRPPFLVAISSEGELPAMTRLLREIIESVLPGDEAIVTARALRDAWKKTKVPMGSRFSDLVRALARRQPRTR